MYKTESIHISNKHICYKAIDNICGIQKNIYNSLVYKIKNHQRLTGNLMINPMEWCKNFRKENDPNYNVVNMSSQITIQKTCEAFKSYKKLIEMYEQKKLVHKPNFPNYKKFYGKYICEFTYTQFKFIDGYIHFPKKSDIQPIKTRLNSKTDLKVIRFIPKSIGYNMELVYIDNYKHSNIFNENEYLSIDLGITNLATCFDTKKLTSFAIPNYIKQKNQNYNRLMGKLRSKLRECNNKKEELVKDHFIGVNKSYEEGILIEDYYQGFNIISRKTDNHYSDRMYRITENRNNKVKDYLHLTSRFVVDYCIKNQIKNIVIGYNRSWKVDVNLGNKINQQFVEIPHKQFVDMIKYKASREGIDVVLTEESYTSKCSSLDLEELCFHKDYLGKRITRGMFITKEGIKIHADVNGAINILRKVSPIKGQEIVQTLRTNITNSATKPKGSLAKLAWLRVLNHDYLVSMANG